MIQHDVHKAVKLSSTVCCKQVVKLTHLPPFPDSSTWCFRLCLGKCHKKQYCNMTREKFDFKRWVDARWPEMWWHLDLETWQPRHGFHEFQSLSPISWSEHLSQSTSQPHLLPQVRAEGGPWSKASGGLRIQLGCWMCLCATLQRWTWVVCCMLMFDVDGVWFFVLVVLLDVGVLNFCHFQITQPSEKVSIEERGKWGIPPETSKQLAEIWCPQNNLFARYFAVGNPQRDFLSGWFSLTCISGNHSP